MGKKEMAMGLNTYFVADFAEEDTRNCPKIV